MFYQHHNHQCQRFKGSSLLTIVLLMYLTLSRSAGKERASQRQTRILLYPFGHCFNSHLLNAERLAKILTDAGHQVDILISSLFDRMDNRQCSSRNKEECPGQEPESGLHMITFKPPPNFVPVCDYDTVDFMLYAPLNQRFSALYDTALSYCDALLSDKAMLHSLRSNNYDLVIVESIDPCSRIIVDFLDVPHIQFVTTGLGHFDSNPRPPSYLPAPVAPYTSQMTLGQRILNTVIKVVYDQAIPAFIGILTAFEELKQKHGINTSMSLENSFDRTSIKLVNSDFAIEYPAPIEPDTVLIGGFAVDAPSPLATDLQEFVDGAGEDGVIVMSFGTLVRRFEPKWTQLFADVFARFPTARIVWRNTGPIGEDYTLSPNIRLLRWLPQVSLLAHPKTRFVISHCGLNSVFEAVRYSVPVLAMPLSGDQFNNAAKVTGHLKIGITADIHTMTRDSLYQDIRTLLDDPQFAINAREVAQRLNDQPMSAAARIRFWVDYVIRHQGAPHLRSFANRLPWYQYYCIDVFLCLFSVGIVVLCLLVLVARGLIRFAVRIRFYCSKTVSNH